MRTSFKTWVSLMGSGSFVKIIFLLWTIFYLVSLYSPFFRISQNRSKSTEMLSHQRGNSGVSFNDTLLSFALRGYLKVRILNLTPSLNPMFDVQIWQMIHHWKAFAFYFKNLQKICKFAKKIFFFKSSYIVNIFAKKYLLCR